VACQVRLPLGFSSLFSSWPPGSSSPLLPFDRCQDKKKNCINEYVPIELMWREKEALSFHKIKP
jgi:hypothetical protein